MGLINGARRAPSPKAAEHTPLLQCQGRSAAAPRASASTFAGSSGPAGTTQLPPTHRTASNASHSGAVAALMPQAGQRSEEYTSELQLLMRNTDAVFSQKKKSQHIDSPYYTIE